MNINRVWAMPSKHTFTIKPIRALVYRYVKNGLWVDPFAGQNSPASLTNDLDCDSPTQSHEDALTYISRFPDCLADGILFDPPYSITQARQCYEGRGMDLLDTKPTSMAYWKKVKDNMARIIKPGGIAICCGWSSMGLGLGRNFEMIEILLVPHGGSKNDTIVTVERRGGDVTT